MPQAQVGFLPPGQAPGQGGLDGLQVLPQGQAGQDKGYRHDGNVGQQDELAHSLEGKALARGQAEVTLDPGEMKSDVLTRSQNRPLPLAHEKGLDRLAFTATAEVVIHGRMSTQEVENSPEEAAGEVGGIGVNDPDPKAEQESTHQHHEPACHRLLHIGRGDEDKVGQVRLTA